ncbi:hypothetical protein BKA65DRAFT_521097 [Rhexocercosporidium sp. MPI-PUGE-AT-0058]|nr:hypothetical protein BKA65DRAFT_521097 [Rhexocercosporidium sp. MPI-PUGE-AT-0058]
MSQSGGEMSNDWSDEDNSWDRGSLPSSYDSNCSLQTNQYHRIDGLSTSHPNNGNSRLEPPEAAARRASSTASTSSTTCDLFSYTTRAESGISSISPRFAAARLPTGALSESPADPILLRFASHSTSIARQISCFRSDSTLYLRTTDSEGTASRSLRSNTLEESGDTPGTSEADSDGVDFFGLDGAPLAPILERESLFAGLEFPKEYRCTPAPSASAHSESDVDDLNEILELRTNLQARPDAALWVPSADTLSRSPDPVQIALAPSPGPAYNAFYSPMRHYIRHDEIYRGVKAITASFPGQASSTGSPSEIIKRKSKSNRHKPLLVQSSVNRISSRHIPFQTQYNTTTNLEWFRGDPTSQICREADFIIDSLNYQVSIFHPGFLVSHLSAASVSALSAELCTANRLTDPLEYPISLSLGFGQHISLQVIPFVPKSKEALRSFQKREGQDKLDVQDSLPIALDLLSIESTAETLDDWLDGILDSRVDLLEYVNLMMERHKRNLSVEILQVVVSWFLETRSELSDSAHTVLRNALKLLLTTSILSMVPRVTSLHSSLSAYLSLHSSSASGSPVPSHVAPKLLTRQIKASTYHLQEKLLQALFFHLMNANEQIAQVRLSAALVISFVLELVMNAGRQFARYANTINNSVFVKEQQVKDYERNIESVVFKGIRASVYDYPGGAEDRIGGLGDRLRSLKSIMKGKGKEDKECRFVSAILTPVL